jgi:hypothetical protein
MDHYIWDSFGINKDGEVECGSSRGEEAYSAQQATKGGREFKV